MYLPLFLITFLSQITFKNISISLSTHYTKYSEYYYCILLIHKQLAIKKRLLKKTFSQLFKRD